MEVMQMKLKKLEEEKQQMSIMNQNLMLDNLALSNSAVSPPLTTFPALTPQQPPMFPWLTGTLPTVQQPHRRRVRTHLTQEYVEDG